MEIGTIIKKLRRQKDLTQEQLAEYLNVSVSAVSQWESGKTNPDIIMLVSLANFFDITVDELLGRENEKEKEIAAYNAKNKVLWNEGKVSETVTLWREAAQKYPGDYECLKKLARALLGTIDIGLDPDTVESNTKEAVLICERILRDCKDNIIRTDATKLLVYLYSNKDSSIADEEKAVKLAETLPSIWNSKEILLEHAYFTEESKEKRLTQTHKNILSLLDNICSTIICEIYDNPEEEIKACQTAIKLWETIIDDGNYLFYHCRFQQIYERLAQSNAKLMRTDETLKALELSLYHAKQMDDIPAGEVKYTSKFVKYAKFNSSETAKNYTETHVEFFHDMIQWKIFDFVRDDPRFKALLK